MATLSGLLQTSDPELGALTAASGDLRATGVPALAVEGPSALRPFQMICHTDGHHLDPRRHSIQASGVYLFKDERLGGTSFYEPVRSAEETALLFRDANTLQAAAFTQKYGIAQGYLCASNDWFTQVGRVAAKWNRIVFYDGSMLHSGDIFAPEKLSDDPLTGRLTLNGFFTSRRKAT